jgi:hypothetical protein
MKWNGNSINLNLKNLSVEIKDYERRIRVVEKTIQHNPIGLDDIIQNNKKKYELEQLNKVWERLVYEFHEMFYWYKK